MTSCKKNRQEHKKSCPAFFSPIMDDFYVGKCCECIKLHKETKQIPPCYFTEEQIQESKDFSIERFIKLNHKCNCKSIESLGKVPDVVEDFVKATLEGVIEDA